MKWNLAPDFPTPRRHLSFQQELLTFSLAEGSVSGGALTQGHFVFHAKLKALRVPRSAWRDTGGRPACLFREGAQPGHAAAVLCLQICVLLLERWDKLKSLGRRITSQRHLWFPMAALPSRDQDGGRRQQQRTLRESSSELPWSLPSFP